MSFGTAGENRVSLSHTDRMFGPGAVHPPCYDGPYVQSQYYTSTMWVFRENLIFFPLSAYFPIPRVTRNTLKPLSLVYNLHIT
jgi:hypothetical protein